MFEPPKIPLRLLRWLCSSSRLEEIEGDLFEEFQYKAETRGIKYARRLYYWTFIRSIRPHLFKGNKVKNSNNSIMFRYHIKTAFRHLIKNKSYTAINIGGLAIGMASAIAISLFIIDYKTMDNDLPDKEAIYRLEQIPLQNGNTTRNPTIHKSVIPAVAPDIPEIKAYTRLSPSKKTISIELEKGRSLQEENFLFADKGFFDVFPLKIKAGNSEKILTSDNQIFITEATAKRLFGVDNPLGKIISIAEQEVSFEISGIMEDPKPNSSLQFSMLGSMAQPLGKTNNTSFESSFYMSTPVYVRLSANVEIASVEDKILTKLKTLTDKPSVVEADYLLSNFEAVKTDISLDDNIIHPVDARVITMFTIVAVFILALAITNYVNLTTAKAIQRSHEVGVRKIVGAQKRTIIRQVLTEALLFNLLALPLSILTLELSLHFFEDILQHSLYFNYRTNPTFILAIIFMPLVFSLVAGIYPSILLSSFTFNPSFQRNFKTSAAGKWLRKSLVVFQFTFSIALIIGAVLIQNQLDFIRNKTLTFEPEQLIVVDAGFNKFRQHGDAIKTEFLSIPGVKKVSYSSNTPGDDFYGRSTTPDLPLPYSRFSIDNEFLDIFNIEILEGSNFPLHTDSARNEVIINEAMLELLDMESPIGKSKINFLPKSNSQIMAVVKNFHFESLHNEIMPTVFHRAEALSFALSKAIIKVETEDYAKTITALEEAWHKFYPNDIFNYQFLDDRIQNMYTSEQRLAGVFNVFTIIAILISCLGLFGLSNYTAQIKMKEISIRKILGAKVSHILNLLTSQLYLLIFIAAILATPVAYYLVTQWLNDFTYRITIDPLVIGLTILSAFVIAGLTMSYQVISAAYKNPVDTLKDE